MNRKTFIKKTAGAILIALPAASLIGCSSSDNDSGVPDPDPDSGENPQVNCIDNGTAVAIGSNHGHTLVVSKADVNAGNEKTYSIQGSSGHDHTITITAENFTSLKNNSSISVVSTNDDDHTHSVTVSCA
ncbi:hypothetical protein ACEZ3G_09485 [Maribacter algicola]|uniref:Uncharacterized protein n=1 Tax=Meishania litoralis TaxID=3434685 RepID=A0ACC7LNZ3_9FLAO